MAKGATGKAVSLREHAKTSDEISKHNRPTSDVVEHLQKQVANAFILYSNYKHYHWQTFGPLFRDLHLLFDEFAKDVLATIYRHLGIEVKHEFMDHSGRPIAILNEGMPLEELD